MTKISRPTKRETYGTVFSQGKHRPVIVSIQPPNVIGFRLKGTRRIYYLTSDGLYLRALQSQIAADKHEKAKERKARKGGV